MSTIYIWTKCPTWDKKVLPDSIRRIDFSSTQTNLISRFWLDRVCFLCVCVWILGESVWWGHVKKMVFWFAAVVFVNSLRRESECGILFMMRYDALRDWRRGILYIVYSCLGTCGGVGGRWRWGYDGLHAHPHTLKVSSCIHAIDHHPFDSRIHIYPRWHLCRAVISDTLRDGTPPRQETWILR